MPCIILYFVAQNVQCIKVGFIPKVKMLYQPCAKETKL